MKKIIALALGIAVMVSSVNVQANSTSKVVIGIVGGLVTGMILKSAAEKMSDNSDTSRYNNYSEAEYRRMREQERQESYNRSCRNEQTYYQDSQGQLRSTGKMVRVCNRVQNNYNY